MSSGNQHPLAPHVQAAVEAGRGRALQPKTAEPGAGRPVAAHVQAAIQAGRGGGVQPKTAGSTTDRPVAAHVQAAMSPHGEQSVMRPVVPRRPPVLQRANSQEPGGGEDKALKSMQRMFRKVYDVRKPETAIGFVSEVASEGGLSGEALGQLLSSLYLELVGVVNRNESYCKTWAGPLYEMVTSLREKFGEIPPAYAVPFLVEALRCINFAEHSKAKILTFVEILQAIGADIQGDPAVCAEQASFSNLTYSDDGRVVTMESQGYGIGP